MTCDEARELITALVDHELRHPERSALENHLGECSTCRRVEEEERALKTEIRAAGDRLRAPLHLRSRLLSDRRIFPEKRRTRPVWQNYIWPGVHIRRPALAIAALLVLALPALYLFDRTSQPVAHAALESYALFHKGNVPVIRANSERELKAQLTRAVDERFEPMGYDLSSMKLPAPCASGRVERSLLPSIGGKEAFFSATRFWHRTATRRRTRQDFLTPEKRWISMLFPVARSTPSFIAKAM
jgi:hypothetical protein